MFSFIMLRLRFPHMPRPYRSPAGVAGAALALVLSGVTLVVLFGDPAYNKGVIGAAVWFVLGIVYFAIHGRRGLVLAPEEAAALAHRKKEGIE
jgi:ethanolamine permease